MIETYKNYNYLIMKNNNIYFNGCIYIKHDKDLTSRIKRQITKILNNYNMTKNDYCNKNLQEYIKKNGVD